MPTPPDIDALTDARLAVFYDEGALERGRRYAEEDRIHLLGVTPGVIKAACKGSGTASYVVTVKWNSAGTGIQLEDTCTCPMEYGCKHCVAAILTARRQAERADRIAAALAGPRGDINWRRTLSGLDTPDGTDDAKARLALQFTVVRGTPGRWGAGTGPRLSIHPMRMGKKGKWIKSGATWQEIESPYGYGPATFDVRQRAAVRAVMASGRIHAYSPMKATMLDTFGPDLWYALDAAVDAGIELIGERPEHTVTVSATRAVASVDLTGDTDGTVTLSADFTLDGATITPVGHDDGTLGQPPHGLWFADDGHVLLVPFEAPLHATVARLLDVGPLVVPARDVDELLDLYQPALSRFATVGSSDDSVTIATSEFAGIVVSVHRTALDAAEVHWMVRYRRGERLTDHPLLSRGGVTRDHSAELQALHALDIGVDLFPGLVDFDGTPRDIRIAGMAALTFLTDVVPQLEAMGVVVELSGDQPTLREATEEPQIALSVSDGADRRDGNDWFDLDISVTVDGEAVDFVPLFAALNLNKEALILPSGTWLRLDRPEFTKLRDLINEARGLADPTAAGVARVNRFQAGWWDELAGLGVVAEQSQRWADHVGHMAALAAPEPIPVPPGLEATLRHYQQEGLDWLAFLHANRLGGILADDMGLGKTVQALALILHVLGSKPDARFLVVAPTSVVENWAREAERFAPSLTVRTIRETAARRKTKLGDEIAGATVVVTSYALFRLEFEQYDEHEWEVLMLDEAQFVKNHTGKTYQCVRRLDAATKIAITGTPLENSLMDLWSLLSITAPGLYPDPKRFSETYRKPIESGKAPELLATLRRRIAPLMRRRTKDAVLTELPPKIEQTVEIDLSPKHARIYETQLQRQRQKVLGLVGDVQKHRFEILKSLTILRQLALDPSLVDEEHHAIGSAKLDRLLDDLEQIVAEGHRALVFSQFTRYLAKVRTRLDAAGIAHAYLDGRTRKRQEAIDRFKDGDAPVFVISLKAGGFGLNLTEADYCFVLDPWWNPATETQAVDRAHRMGQQNPVMVYRYVSTHTIEEKVMELKARKADLFNSVMDAEGALAGALTEDDIRGLLDLS